MRNKGAGVTGALSQTPHQAGRRARINVLSLAASGLHARAGIEAGAKGERYRGAFSPCETCCGLDGLVGNVQDQNRLLVLRGAIKLIHEILLFDPRRLDRPNPVYSRNAFGSIRPTRPKREPVARRLWACAITSRPACNGSASADFLGRIECKNHLADWRKPRQWRWQAAVRPE